MRHSPTACVLAFTLAGAVVSACHHAAVVATPVTIVARGPDADSARRARLRVDSLQRDARRRDSIATAAKHAAMLAAEQAVAAARATLFAPVHFDFEKSEIRPDDQALLDRKVALLAKNQKIRL